MTQEFLRKREEESFNDYHIRLFENMNEYGIDKFKIAELLNEEMGSNYDESKWRKDYAQYKKWKDYLVSKELDDEILQKYEKIEQESEKKKIRFQDRQREYKKFLRSDARIDEIKEMIQVSINDLNKNKPLNWFNKVEPTRSETDGVLLISDWHKGLFTINYWNTFDDNVFYERINELTNRVVEHGKFHDIENLHLFQIGDLIHGTLHRLTRIMDTEDAVRSTMHVAEALSEMVSVFANEFHSVTVYSARGNHERVNSNKNNEVTTESFNDFVPWFMEERLSKLSNVTLKENEYDSEIIVANILGNDVFAVHGHRDRLGSVVQDLTMMIKIFPKYVFSGHIHKNYENEIHKVHHIVNSSLSGVDDFAKDIRKTSIPAQKFMIFTPKGRLATYNIEFE